MLLANDFYLKAAFSNWLTGKLSDLAGILLLSLVAFCAFPRAPYSVMGSIAAVFAYWKSPLSQPLIEGVNALELARFGRVVDYGDLVALIVLPLAWRVSRNIDRFQVSRRALREGFSVPIFAVALLAVMGTSVLPYHDHYSIRRPDGYEPLDAALAASVIADVARKHALKCVACDRLTEQAEYRGRSMSMSYRIVDRRIIYFAVEDYPGLFSGDGRMQTLRRDLKQELGARLPYMEFVLPLPETRRRP